MTTKEVTGIFAVQWQAGYNARYAMKPETANPHHRFSRQHSVWLDGWLDADREIAEANDD